MVEPDAYTDTAYLVELPEVGYPDIAVHMREIWLTVVVDGRRERLCKLSYERALFLNRQLSNALWSVKG